ncbi:MULTISPECIES: DUF2797 domain-containing protein [unclassified Oceanobacter]|uniref:DUF2797 domain-containing protein n=1 Tax=unclassified Oceanobacter TaxID=2620260 RepID=UPI0027328420|nr:MULTISPECIES: DUF2797 domain-containing protein [unclassified Oceanobacter]MDP2504794.1 DUF2797 domain-containing protein [Oceanobacter sp. 3_MG-2023]MDP2546237.1 DUF2797 domain-containing protein [Oceanobacter sp. 4_MG-2023]
MTDRYQGALSKMAATAAADGQVAYRLSLGRDQIDMNALIGQRVALSWQGAIHCCACGRSTRKSFSQGYCYPCFSKLAQCDRCMMSPETCHFHLGTCREPDWAEQVCFQPHYVYLANSSGIKVGITRAGQLPTRWLDQGAVQGMAIARVASRRVSGMLEDLLRQRVADKTNWRTMLKGQNPLLDLGAARDDLLAELDDPIRALTDQLGDDAIEWLPASRTVSHSFHYPVLEYPTKVTSHNLDKTPELQGRLLGIKGQYLMLDSGVINLRKYTSYQVTLTHIDAI